MIGNLLDSLMDDETRDRRFIGRPMVDTPRYVVMAVALYLLFVLKLGPAFMRNRPPMKLVWMIRIYNIVQIICNSIVVYSAIFVAMVKLGYHPFCEPPHQKTDPDTMYLCELGYAYFYVRIMDFLDTVFFVFKKKHSHITFLHVYHHMAVVLNYWLYMRQGWGNSGALVGVLNPGVHVIMYFYYFLSTFPSLKTKRLLSFKKYLTTLQIIQFCVYIIHFFIVLWSPDHCGLPLAVIYNGGINCTALLILFCRFYTGAYKGKPLSAKSD